MSKIRIGALLLVLSLLGTPVLATDHESLSALDSARSAWSRVVEVVKEVLAPASEGESRLAVQYSEGDPGDDEFGPGNEPNG